jgi:hypothetical protein
MPDKTWVTHAAGATAKSWVRKRRKPCRDVPLAELAQQIGKAFKKGVY